MIKGLFRISSGLEMEYFKIQEHMSELRSYAFDLYVRAGNAYQDLRKDNYEKSKSEVISGNVEWFFLSGGYGIIHALEAAKKYQATFTRGIAYKKKIPFTRDLWKTTLPSLCDAIMSKFDPEWVYVFGSQDYTNFIKQTNLWRKKNIRMFESTGSSGPYWLSPKLNQLVNLILDENLKAFNEEYAKFVKQQVH